MTILFEKKRDLLNRFNNNSIVRIELNAELVSTSSSPKLLKPLIVQVYNNQYISSLKQK